MTSYFKGQGERNAEPPKLPEVDLRGQGHGSGYRASADLAAAVEAALTLGMPLLLTGEPGSGKSRLADAIAWELNLPHEKPFRFVVKSDTRATDLFYRFDTVGRFHATGKSSDEPQRFISFEALGKALLYAKPRACLTDSPLNLPEQLQGGREHPGDDVPCRRSVVLIDEIDKAPRDVPNDILTEIEDMAFRIPEFEVAGGEEVRVDLREDEVKHRPVVIITSNSERNLPDAFLRRCVYFHLTLPPFEKDQKKGSRETTIETICRTRLGTRYQDAPTLSASGLALFRYMRSDAVTMSRRPGLAELLNFLDLILPGKAHGEDPHDLESARPLKEQSQSRLLSAFKLTLLKEPEMQEQAEDLLLQWQKQS